MQDSTHQAKIMVIDSVPANHKDLVDLLSTEGYQVNNFTNKEFALKAVEHEPPDLILHNMDLPEQDGCEYCTLVMAYYPAAKNIPVIVISASADIQEKIKAVECRAADCIRKPFNAEEIKARIKIHLNRARVDLLEKEI